MAKKVDPKRRELILANALSLFAEKGYYGVSVGDITKASGIAQGSLYTYFKSKGELVNALYCKWKEVLSEYVARDMTGLSGRVLHHRLWNNLIDFATDHPVALSFLEAQYHASYLTSESLLIHDTLKELGLKLYREILNDPDLGSDDLSIFMSVSYGAFIQLSKEVKAGQLKFDKATVTTTENSVWKAITAISEPIVIDNSKSESYEFRSGH